MTIEIDYIRILTERKRAISNSVTMTHAFINWSFFQLNKEIFNEQFPGLFQIWFFPSFLHRDLYSSLFSELLDEDIAPTHSSYLRQEQGQSVFQGMLCQLNLFTFPLLVYSLFYCMFAVCAQVASWARSHRRFQGFVAD